MIRIPNHTGSHQITEFRPAGKLIFLSLLLCLILIPGFADVASAQDSSSDAGISLAVFSGLVEVKKSGTDVWVPAEDGDIVKTGDRLRSSEDARAEVTYLSDKTLLRLQPGSEITFLGESVDIHRGNIWLRVTKRNSRFEVVSPTAIAGVRGTVFEVEISPSNNDTRVLVYGGKVEVTKISRRRGEIMRGQSLMLKKGNEVNVNLQTIPERARTFSMASRLKKWQDKSLWKRDNLENRRNSDNSTDNQRNHGMRNFNNRPDLSPAGNQNPENSVDTNGSDTSKSYRRRPGKKSGNASDDKATVNPDAEVNRAERMRRRAGSLSDPDNMLPNPDGILPDPDGILPEPEEMRPEPDGTLPKIGDIKRNMNADDQSSDPRDPRRGMLPPMGIQDRNIGMPTALPGKANQRNDDNTDLNPGGFPNINPEILRRSGDQGDNSSIPDKTPDMDPRNRFGNKREEEKIRQNRINQEREALLMKKSGQAYDENGNAITGPGFLPPADIRRAAMIGDPSTGNQNLSTQDPFLRPGDLNGGTNSTGTTGSDTSGSNTRIQMPLPGQDNQGDLENIRRLKLLEQLRLQKNQTQNDTTSRIGTTTKDPVIPTRTDNPIINPFGLPKRP
ncbi:MAG: hypothetical protein CVV64_12325 [Candidatus Wallbacteria bacterium HGW-Wallbacteria-1]|jgi:hypothetical protein|uniref:FecR protein domain-containing protein n=1 Tax=Candidatus Wallbacteria bacterium HGW-Wallbacteria-1 TaxID=2013854 RepID=A0A2N1PN91_9BACT|nr:MAG: hypothetical protein CVV64_12325 [Candidatus Wallbacteria bacterium HGW-Wallbacteria-1]